MRPLPAIPWHGCCGSFWGLQELRLPATRENAGLVRFLKTVCRFFHAPHPIQQALLDVDAIQCGMCTPGMVMSGKALLDRNDSPTETQVREALAGNICRCTGYEKYVEGILLAAKRIREAKGDKERKGGAV